MLGEPFRRGNKSKLNIIIILYPIASDGHLELANLGQIASRTDVGAAFAD